MVEWQGRVNRGTVAVLTAAMLSAACGVSPRTTLDARVSAERISSQLAARYAIPAPLVRCPPGVPDRPGTRFVCTASVDGQPLTLDATVSAASGAFGVAARQAVVPLAAAESQLQEQIQQSTGHRPSVSCPSDHPLLVVAVGAAFGCTAAFPGEASRALTVTVVDTTGHLRFDLAPAASKA